MAFFHSCALHDVEVLADFSRQLARFLHRLSLRRQYRVAPTAWLFDRGVDDLALAESDDLQLKIVSLGHEHALAFVVRPVVQVVDE